ncbi:MAG: YjjG family noncanonical pyrimidine nucleotidase [Clostridia bacterium]|nr:YjjG family noncanonical pyrimidine nucleotidase [Clostridia bacterium]
MIKVILWDIDGTVLDFIAAEKEAIRSTLAHFDLGEVTDEDIKDYSAINKSYWKRLETGELTKPQILKGRFVDFFKLKGIKFEDFDALNAEYQVRLGDTICFFDDSFNIIKALKGKVKQYAVTNGTKVAQDRKLTKSGLIDLFDGVFISEEVGAEKPSQIFFDKVFDTIGQYEKEEVLIVGDSLSSDMLGGNNAGILCCWYDRGIDQPPHNLKIDYRIGDLHKVLDIIG